MEDRTEQILNLLEDINKIPRKSENKGPITSYFKKWAKINGFNYREDHVQNLIIEIPPTAGYESAPKIVLQGHTDMVCEKTPESDHDFSKDPIIHVRKGDWLSADGTSLGADNGIGLAMAMEVAVNKDIKHPALELLFTTDEEVGLWGADEIKPGFIKSKIMINLDSEDLGVFTLGCAGAVISHVDYDLKYEKTPSSYIGLTLKIGGFRGGHSGSDIHRNRGNASDELIRGLEGLFKEIPFHLVSINGGSAMNAISRAAEVIIACEEKKLPAIEKWWESFSEIIMSENKTVEEHTILSTGRTEFSGEALSTDDTIGLLSKLRLVPHGIQFMNAALPDQVETSLNFGIIKSTEKGVRITTMQRGSVKSRLVEITDRIETFAKITGGVYSLETFMDPWQPDWDSFLVIRSLALWKKLYGETAEMDVTHGALECGVIGNLCNIREMISFGPDIEDPHSPDERLRISSVGKTFNFLVELLAGFKEGVPYCE
ncbi:MAG: beta-Ala-His dipeptidase [Spirochaetaceae bacterium]|jgi:dipeptidase D|nr:beta-Ala-His dipeptidase [Spirochaetaceae bacterium]